MLIVSGQIHLDPADRAAFLQASWAAMVAARQAEGCLDFVVAADPLEPDRVNVYEHWRSEPDLLAFRGEGPPGDMTQQILRADVRRHHIASSGPA